MGRTVTARRPGIDMMGPGVTRPSDRDEDVDVVIPTKTPDMEWLDLTLGSLEMQTHQPRVTVVDCSSEPLTIETALPAQVVDAEACTIGGQRLRGVAQTDGDVVLHLDEDAVVTRPDHIERALSHLASPDISGVGGRVAPIRGNRSGQLAASLSPVSAWFPMHAREACPDGGECFDGPLPTIAGFANEDWALKHRLASLGTVVEDPDLVVLTDLPTQKQRLGGAVGAGAVLAATRFL